ncbi:MAG: hypothetical protein IT426_02010 [Pirellulales bacterium]|nr:hypothetical protein [Pirellulales bacterium]
MPETTNTSDSPPPVKLKDPALAAFLAWLVPGLGHWYQGRRAKAVLFFVCIMGIFTYGCYLGSSSEKIQGADIKIGYARAVYFAWNDEDWRMHFFCQIGVGLPTLPAIVQALRVNGGKEPMGSFMAPPRMQNPPANFPNAGENQQPTLHQLHFNLEYFEMATTYTEIAGLLNVLAIYDAFAGPVFLLSAKKEDEEGESEKKKDEKKEAKK